MPEWRGQIECNQSQMMRSGVKGTLLFRLVPLIVILIAPAVFGQVSISVHPSKNSYLKGEPIIVVIEVGNIGAEAIPYGSGCDFDIKVSAEQEEPEPWLLRYGCFRGHGSSGSCWGIDHPPHIQPGKSLIIRRLLRGYPLESGRYTLKIGGKAPLDGDIEGNIFSEKVPIDVYPATESELRERYAPFVQAAQRVSFVDMPLADQARLEEEKALAKQAIAEMAPSFLEDMIKGFAQDAGDQGLAITGLARINSSSSRAALVELFSRSADSYFQRDAVQTLANIGSLDQFDFFSGLLLGEKASSDLEIQRSAIEGLGRIGGEQAVQVLAAFRTNSPDLNSEASYALGMTRSRHAVDVLIDRYGLFGGDDSICAALATLTHRQWCDGSGQSRVQHWRSWWDQHESATPIYGDDQCNGAFAAQPIE